MGFFGLFGRDKRDKDENAAAGPAQPGAVPQPPAVPEGSGSEPTLPDLELPSLPTTPEPASADELSDARIAEELLAAAGFSVPDSPADARIAQGVAPTLPAVTVERLQQVAVANDWVMNQVIGAQYIWGIFDGHHIVIDAGYDHLLFIAGTPEEPKGVLPIDRRLEALELARSWNHRTNLGTMVIHEDDEAGTLSMRMDVALLTPVGATQEQLDEMIHIGISCAMQGINEWNDFFHGEES